MKREEQKQFVRKIEEYWTEHGQDNALEAFRATRQLFIEESGDSGLLDPDTGDMEFINQVYRDFHGRCLHAGMPPLADTVLRDWWKAWGVRQHEKGIKYHRALPAFHLRVIT